MTASRFSGLNGDEYLQAGRGPRQDLLAALRRGFLHIDVFEFDAAKTQVCISDHLDRLIAEVFPRVVVGKVASAHRGDQTVLWQPDGRAAGCISVGVARNARIPTFSRAFPPGECHAPF